MDEKSKKLIKFGLIGFGVFILLLVIIVGVGSCGVHNDGNVDGDDIVGENELVVYKSDSGLCFSKSTECNRSPFSIKVKTENAKIISIASNNLYLLYKDDALYLYDVNGSKSSKLELNSNYDYYNIIVNKVAKGIVYGKDLINNNSYSNLGYYDINSKKKLYDNKYNSIEYVDGNYLLGKSISGNSSSLLKIDSEEVIIERNNTCISYEIRTYGYFDIYLLHDTCNKKYEILNTDKNSLFNNLGENNFSIDLSGNIYILDGTNSVKVYGSTGAFMKNVSFEGTYKHLIINYVVIINNNKIYLKDLNKNSSPVEIGEWSSGYTYCYNSDYYAENELFSTNEKRAGIYILFVKNSKSVAGTEYYYDIRSGKVETISVSDYREALKRDR